MKFPFRFFLYSIASDGETSLFGAGFRKGFKIESFGEKALKRRLAIQSVNSHIRVTVTSRLEQHFE